MIIKKLILHNFGVFVTGSDCSRSKITDKLSSHGIFVTIGHSTNLVQQADFIIYSAAIKDNEIKIMGVG